MELECRRKIKVDEREFNWDLGGSKWGYRGAEVRVGKCCGI